MMRIMKDKRKYKKLVGDFETTVYEGQEYTEVWASAVVEIGSENVLIHHSIGETYQYLLARNENIIIYYHNLKFDGNFWLYYIESVLHYNQALINTGGLKDFEFLETGKMKASTYKYLISDMGQWYSITIKTPKNKIIEIRDSLKLLPFSVKAIGDAFKTKHKKLDMEYKGFRYAGCEITEEEQKYIANDVLVVKEALEIMFDEGHDKLTIGSCCYSEFQSEFLNKQMFDAYFPNLYEMEMPEEYGSANAGEYIRRSYRGGWCYLDKGKENKKYYDGITLDVNSLYPSMMHSESGNYYPVGEPTFWQGDFIPDEAKEGYFFVRFKTRFFLKEGFLPFVQIKRTFLYRGTESLRTSDIYDEKTGTYCQYYEDFDKTIKEARPTMTMTCIDFKLFLEHYRVENLEILDGCYFSKQIGIFDEYINKYRKIKVSSTGARRTLAKLFLNSLYGRMSTNTNSSFKVCRMNEDNILEFAPVYDNKKKPGYIAIGSAITSYARNFTIRAAQQNYYGNDKPGFIYADTDSIHCDLPLDKIKGVRIHESDFCSWKCESEWDVGWYVRQKTYIEHVTAIDGNPVNKPFYEIKCAGLPNRSKELLIKSFDETYEVEDLTEEEKTFTNTHRDISDFTLGICIPGKLLPKRIRGGIVLVDCNYEMR